MNDFLFYLIAFIFLPKIAMAVDFESNKFAIMIFGSFVFITLLITYFASKIIAKSNYFAAGEKISGFQNGLAIAGDYMSAASVSWYIRFSFFFSGFDGLIYSIGFLVGWPIILFLIAEKLKNLGKFTLLMLHQ